jgi:hypothetical protein
MNINVTWANEEKTALLHTFREYWVWEDFFEASRRSMEMMDEVDHMVDIIADARNAVLPSGALAQMTRILENAATRKHPNGGAYILVGASRVIETFARIYAQAFPSHGAKVLFTRTMEEAFELSASRRAPQP